LPLAHQKIIGVVSTGALGVLVWPMENYDTIKGWPLQILINFYTVYRTSHNILWIEMPEDFYDLGFEDTLTKHTGMNLDTLYSDFTSHMKNYDKQMLSKKIVFFWN